MAINYEGWEDWEEEQEQDLMMEWNEKKREHGWHNGNVHYYDGYDFETFLYDAREDASPARKEFLRRRWDELMKEYGNKEEEREEPQTESLTSLRDSTEEKESELLELEQDIATIKELLDKIETKYKALQEKISAKNGIDR